MLMLNPIAICPASLAPNVVDNECERFADVILLSTRARMIDIRMRRALVEYSAAALTTLPPRKAPEWPITGERHPYFGAEALRDVPSARMDVVSFSNGAVSPDGNVALILGRIDAWQGARRTVLYELERHDEDWRITREVELQYEVP